MTEGDASAWRKPRLGGRAAAMAIALALAACTPPPRDVPPPPAPTPIPVATPALSSADAKFYAFVRDFRAEAIAAGIRPETYDASMAGIHRNPRVEELNRKQPEFIKPVWQYLDTTVSALRVASGQAMLQRYGGPLASMEARYRVPKEILVAVWGIESGYGAAQGNFDMFEALATLAYDGPRQAFARRELIAAIRMEERQRLNPRAMTSSWAGAFGQTQFVPSSFLAHAVDGDGDGRIDLWHSPADALASAAVLLQGAGWQWGEPCYQEVRLPSGFPYEQADAENFQPIGTWSSLGVRDAHGEALPTSSSMAGIYLPAGWRGPAFLVFPNFKAVLTYNNADSYALAVCNLAERFGGGGQILASWPTDQRPLGPSERIAFQTDLKALGYDPGDIDGVLGRKARAALRRYQKDHHLPADGFPTVEMLGTLNADLKSRAS
ncbi:MAG TPA: lytic murein transglycosylase [Rhizomicrobium sp.]|jgi:membrane-bound lytic murein transglycosylase B|nr:lytic murein transglycosylase [Rhizomicrobium sp.]